MNEAVDALNALKTIPAWLGTAVIGALIALFSFVAKTLYQWWLELRKEKSARLASLLELASLLRAAWIINNVQEAHAKNLYQMLQRDHPDRISHDHGYESTFTQLYDHFTPEQAELHTMIRGMSQHALRPINQSMSAWLKDDIYFKTASIGVSDKKRKLLADRLFDLEAHLILWESKFNTWIPYNPKHALVYLDDEKAHGVAFPFDIEKIIKDVVKELNKAGPTIPL